MIARCDAVENYMFLRDSQLMYWIVIWGGSQEFYIFRTGSRLKNLTPNNRQHKGMTNSEMEMCINQLVDQVSARSTHVPITGNSKVLPDTIPSPTHVTSPSAGPFNSSKPIINHKLYSEAISARHL